MTGLFSRRSAPGRAGQVKAWVVESLALTENDLVTVAELVCHEPGCPPFETVVAVHGPDGISRTWCIHTALAEIKQPDMLAKLVGDACSLWPG